jgi:hypothetical protein
MQPSHRRYATHTLQFPLDSRLCVRFGPETDVAGLRSWSEAAVGLLCAKGQPVVGSMIPQHGANESAMPRASVTRRRPLFAGALGGTIPLRNVLQRRKWPSELDGDRFRIGSRPVARSILLRALPFFRPSNAASAHDTANDPAVSPHLGSQQASTVAASAAAAQLPKSFQRVGWRAGSNSNARPPDS